MNEGRKEGTKSQGQKGTITPPLDQLQSPAQQVARQRRHASV